MIEQLKNFVANKIDACKVLVVGGNVTLHPIFAPKFQTVQTLLPRVLRCENFCGRSAND
ncbi:MAG: hypothetical protein IJ685_04850 [Selenomonadaceae bacterium]|nr:hypothetical protein [Selenomonadaceae bacterium]